MVIQGFVDTQGALKILGGISRQRLHTLQATGRIACVWQNGRRLYREKEVERLRDSLGIARQHRLAMKGDGEGN